MDQPSQSDDPQDESSEFVLVVDDIPENSKTRSQQDDVQLQLEWMSVSLCPVRWMAAYARRRLKRIRSGAARVQMLSVCGAYRFAA